MMNSELEFVVERGMPIPRKKAGVGAVSKYPFYRMDVGDSFSADKDKADTIEIAARKYGYRKGMNFSVRRLEDCVRVWRVK